MDGLRMHGNRGNGVPVSLGMKENTVVNFIGSFLPQFAIGALAAVLTAALAVSAFVILPLLH